jgi:hypothetical protein
VAAISSLASLFYPEEVVSTFHRNVTAILADYTCRRHANVTVPMLRSVEHEALKLLGFVNEQGGPQDEVGDVYMNKVQLPCGARGNVVVKALCYRSQGRGFGTR